MSPKQYLYCPFLSVRKTLLRIHRVVVVHRINIFAAGKFNYDQWSTLSPLLPPSLLLYFLTIVQQRLSCSTDKSRLWEGGQRVSHDTAKCLLTRGCHSWRRHADRGGAAAVHVLERWGGQMMTTGFRGTLRTCAHDCHIVSREPANLTFLTPRLIRIHNKLTYSAAKYDYQIYLFFNFLSILNTTFKPLYTKA